MERTETLGTARALTRLAALGTLSRDAGEGCKPHISKLLSRSAGVGTQPTGLGG